jgi:hypothetical protein
LLVALGLACHSKKAPPPDVTLSSAPLPASSAMAAPDRDPTFMRGLSAMLEACGPKWNEKFGFDSCTTGKDAWKEFREQSFANLEATCLSLLEDKDPKLRWVAQRCFHGWGPNWASVRKLGAKDGERFFAALVKEPLDSPIDTGLAKLAFDLEGDVLAEKLRVYALAPTTAADVKIVLAVTTKRDSLFELVKGLRDSSDKRLVAAAVHGYAVYFDGHEEEACTFWKSHLEDSDKAVRTGALGHLTGGYSGGCAEDAQGYDNYCSNVGGPGLNMPRRLGEKTDQKNPKWCSAPAVNAALDAIEKRVADNEVDGYGYAQGLASIARHPKSTPAQKRRAIAALRKLVDTKGAKMRSSTVEELVESDPEGLVYLQKYASDPALKSAIDSARSAKTKR